MNIHSTRYLLVKYVFAMVTAIFLMATAGAILTGTFMDNLAAWTVCLLAIPAYYVLFRYVRNRSKR